MQKLHFSGPLAGLNVVDFGHYYAGPMAAMLLADQGANVIRIVRPIDKELPEQQYRLLNRNKKCLTLDLKSEQGKTQAQSLIAKADVVIENFRPGVMKRLGLDYASVKISNPGLIYLSLPGFASTDKERAQIQAWEGILGAAACAYTQTNFLREPLKLPPVYTRVPQCSTYGAICGGVAVMAALVAREKQGLGTVIEVPLVNAGLSAIGANHVGLADEEAFAIPAAMLFDPEEHHDQQLQKMSGLISNFFGLASKHYECADKRKIYVSPYMTNQCMERFLEILGIDQQVKREGFVNVGPWETGLDNDVGNTSALSEERKQRLTQLICDALLTQTSAYWDSQFAEASVPAAVIRTRDEYLSLEPMLESGVLTKLGENDSLTVPGRLGDVSGPEGALIGSYCEAETIEFEAAINGFNNDSPNKPTPSDDSASTSKLISLKKGDLLKGLKVLDFCNVIAGPTSGQTLAEYGADVIKIEAPNGIVPGFIINAPELNQGKRSMLVDLKTAPGQSVFKRLVEWADVVLHNCLDDTAKRLGLQQDQLAAINSKVVSCQLSGNGGTHRGHWENRGSYDNLIQGQCGLLAQYGSLEQPLWHGAMTSADTIGGYSVAFTSLLAVYQQRTTGYAGEARTSLIRATNHYQLPHMIADQGGCNWIEALADNETTGQFTLGPFPWQRLYQCSDGWIYVCASQPQADAFSDRVTGNSSLDENALEAAFLQKSIADWQVSLSEIDIVCHPVLNTEAIVAKAQVRQVCNEAATETVDGTLEILRWEDHPCGVPVSQLVAKNTYVGEDSSWARLAPAPRYGKHTVEILKELGYKSDEVAELIRLKVVHEYLPGLGDKKTYFFALDEK